MSELATRICIRPLHPLFVAEVTGAKIPAFAQAAS